MPITERPLERQHSKSPSTRRMPTSGFRIVDTTPTTATATATASSRPPLPPPPPPPLMEPPHKKHSSSSPSSNQHHVTIGGGGPLRLKVSHKEQGRVVISLANSDKTLVQVHIDESVLKFRGVYKSKASERNLKDIPKKKHTKAKTTSSKPSSSRASTKTAVKATSLKRSKSKEKIYEETTTKTTISKTKSSKTKTVNQQPAPQPQQTSLSRQRSIASLHSFESTVSDDTTRSPKDLFKNIPTASSHKPLSDQAPLGNFFEESEYKQEISSPNIEEADDGVSVMSESVFTSAAQQRRFEQRQRRIQQLQRQSDDDYEETRSVKSNQSGGSIIEDPPAKIKKQPLTPKPQKKKKKPSLAIQTMKLADQNKRATTTTTHKKRTGRRDLSSSRHSTSRGRSHSPHKEPTGSDNRQHRSRLSVIEDVRKVELTNRIDRDMDRSATRRTSMSDSPFKADLGPIGELDDDDIGLLGAKSKDKKGDVLADGTSSKWLSKAVSKVLKRRKAHKLF